MTAKKTTTTKKKVEPSIWETLSKINVNEHTEKKGRFTYLSWSWAWGILMEHYPDATFENHLNQDGYPCFFDRNGYAMVRVTLCIGDKCHTEDFMIIDNSNNAIKNPDSSDVNTALKRCLVKAMAYFGLGHYIYAGEDLPREEVEAVKEAAEKESVATQATDEQVADVKRKIKAADNPQDAEKRTLAWAGVKKLSEISSEKATILLQAKK